MITELLLKRTSFNLKTESCFVFVRMSGTYTTKRVEYPPWHAKVKFPMVNKGASSSSTACVGDCSITANSKRSPNTHLIAEDKLTPNIVKMIELEAENVLGCIEIE